MNNKGYTLYLVLIIMSVSAILYSVYVYTLQDTNRAVTNELHHLRARLLAESGIERAMYFLHGGEGRDLFWETDSFAESLPPYGTIHLSCRRLGGYSLVKSIGTARKVSRTELASIGGEIPEQVTATLTLTGRMQNLVLDEDAGIQGKVCLSSGNVLKGKKKERIKNSYEWTHNRFSPPLPFDCSPLATQIETFKNSIAHPTGTASTSYKETNANDTTLRPRKIYLSGNHTFRNVHISDSEIIVNGTAVIEDGTEISGSLISAEKCYLRGGISEMSLFFASDSMHLQSGIHSSQFFSTGEITCSPEFRTGSGAFIFSHRSIQPDSTMSGGITFSNNAKFVGHVVCFEDTTHQIKFFKKAPGITIGDNSKIHGTVFTNGMLSVARSEITGYVWAKMISVQRENSSYSNWLFGSRMKGFEDEIWVEFPALE